MNYALIMILFVAVMQLTGCSSIKLVPEQVANGRINTADNSLTVTANGVEITAGMDDTSINAYNLDGTVTAFRLMIKNTTDNEIAFSDESYVLVDDSGMQYSLLSPESIRAMLKKDSYYLMPYPYVGFYYLEDYEKTNSFNKFNSALPYYYDLYPQDIFTKSLQAKTIIPGMKVEGLVYFKVDPAEHKQLKLLVFQKGTSKSTPPQFTFPFIVKK